MSMSEELIPEHRCWELLATVSVGSLALSVRALPVILPVQYYLDGHRLAICLGHHQIPERALNDVIIAFAADAIDPVTRSGWSVEVQGRSVIPRRLGADTACGRPTPGQGRTARPGESAWARHAGRPGCSRGTFAGIPVRVTCLRSHGYGPVQLA